MSGYRSNLDITGNVYGRLTVLGYDHSAKHKSYWRCRCECGKETIVNRYSLTSGKTRSCGCLRSDSVRMVRGGFHKLDVSERTKNWIRKHYKHTKNAEIQEEDMEAGARADAVRPSEGDEAGGCEASPRARPQASPAQEAGVYLRAWEL